MSRTYTIKKVPEEITEWFKRYQRKHHNKALHIHRVYTYKGMHGKTYGIEICSEDGLYDNSHQGTLTTFIMSMRGSQ